MLEPHIRESSDQLFVGSRRNVLQGRETCEEFLISSRSGRCRSPLQKQFCYEDFIGQSVETPREVAEVLASPLKDSLSE